MGQVLNLWKMGRERERTRKRRGGWWWSLEEELRMVVVEAENEAANDSIDLEREREREIRLEFWCRLNLKENLKEGNNKAKYNQLNNSVTYHMDQSKNNTCNFAIKI